MTFSEYYEVLCDDDTVLLDVHLNEEGKVEVSIGDKTIGINSILKLLNDANEKLT
jgi:hypothetical protein